MAKVRLLDPKDGKRRLDRYELIGELASGGMATVFLARLGGVGGFQRFVAIKRLHPHLANEQDFIEMFLDEARLAAGIHHPHVVPILEVGESENGYYLVMEYVEGDTLARLMARSLARAHPIPRPVLMRMILDTLAGLHAAHELVDAAGNPVQLVHRDVSPQNVLIGVDGCSRITDFGVAHAASRLQNTRTDRLKGKLAYMSPEQARAGDVDRRSDVFAMGVILWEVLAAKRLFKGENEAITLQRVTIEPIPRLSSVVQGVHPALEQVCSMALERNRDRRFATAADMAEALERAARVAAKDSATDLGVASPREVAAYVQAALGEDIAAQRESVRAWLAHSEPSSPKTQGVRPGELAARPPGYDVTMTMPLDREVAEISMGIRPAAGRVGRSSSPGNRPSSPGEASGSVSRPRQGSGSIPVPARGLGSIEDEPSRTPSQSSPRERSRSGPVFAGAAALAGEPGRGSPNPSSLLGEPSGASSGYAPNGAAYLDGASADEVPVEPRADDEDDHETWLMDREEAGAIVSEMVNRRAAQAAAKSTPPSRPSEPNGASGRATPLPSAYRVGASAERDRDSGRASSPGKAPSIVAPFSEDGTPSKSIESYMIPARPPPSRTPQLVAMIVTVLVAAAGVILWVQLRQPARQVVGARPAVTSTATATVTAATTATVATATAAPAPPPADNAPATTATGTVLTPSALPNAPVRVKGKMPKGKGKGKEPPPPADDPPPVAPPPTPPPDTKVPEDIPNPYRDPPAPP